MEEDIKQRHNEDSHDGSWHLGLPIKKNDNDGLNRLLRDALLGISGEWEEDNHGHDGLLIEEFTYASTGYSYYFTVD